MDHAQDDDRAEDLYFRLEALSKVLESSGRIDEHEHPNAYATVLDAMNLVWQALHGGDMKVLEVAVAVLSRALDDLVGACMDEEGKLCAPGRGAVMRARSMLPPACKHALKKS